MRTRCRGAARRDLDQAKLATNPAGSDAAVDRDSGDLMPAEGDEPVFERGLTEADHDLEDVAHDRSDTGLSRKFPTA